MSRVSDTYRLWTAIDEYDALVTELLRKLDPLGKLSGLQSERLQQIRQSIKFKTVLEAKAETQLCLESK